MLIAPMRKDFPAGVAAFVNGMFPPGADTAIVHRVIRDMSAADQRVAIGSMEEMFRYDIRKALADMRLPVRAINCDLWPTDIEGNRRHFASFDVSYMPGRGHFVMMEDSTAFNRLLAEAVVALGNNR
jgi:pimeloyl-ACP methyl ester carboxylesterase